MKKIFLGCILAIFSVFPAQALEVKIIPIDYVNGKTLEENESASLLTRRDLFELLSELTSWELRESYRYIQLQFKNSQKIESTDYELLQKMVYLTIIDNGTGGVYLDKPIRAASFYNYVEDILGEQILPENPKVEKVLNSRFANELDVDKIREFLLKWEDVESSEGSEISQKKNIFNDVYNTLTDYHYDLESLDKQKMIYSAIQGLAEGTGDKFTVYFPPVESKSFQDSLAWEIEGIGAYVDFLEPWVLYIKSPIPWSPAEKAGLKSDDIIVKVWDKLITQDNSLAEVVSWIKWKAGTQVELEVKRDGKTMHFSVTREKIIIKDIESKLVDYDTLLISLKNFWDHASQEFTDALTWSLNTNAQIDTLIFDLRNNPGGYLNVVNDMLWHFVPKWEVVSQIRYRDYIINNKSKGKTDVDFTRYKIVILQNQATASASEIFIWTIKDYFPNAIIVWEKSYGKGSVQTVRGYNDGSSLKYTVAKWFTGKTNTGIDGVWIEPDIILPFDIEAFKKDGSDNQLKKALEQ